MGERKNIVYLYWNNIHHELIGGPITEWYGCTNCLPRAPLRRVDRWINGMDIRSVILELRLEAGLQRSGWHGYTICNPRAPTGGGITEK